MLRASGRWRSAWSSGDDFVASVVGQIYNAEIRIFAAFCSEGMSLRGHLEEIVRPWLSANAHRLTLLGGYENFKDVDIKGETHRAAQEILGDQWTSISKPWEIRRDAMRDLLGKAALYFQTITAAFSNRYHST